jgi:hypothetical protein
MSISTVLKMSSLTGYHYYLDYKPILVARNFVPFNTKNLKYLLKNYTRMTINWKYNGNTYESRKEMKRIFGWSTCKWDAKFKEGKITQIIIEDTTYEKLHNDSK